MMFDVRFSHKLWPDFRFHIMWTLLLFSGFTLPVRTQLNTSLLVAKFSTITTELMPRPVAMIRHLWDDNRVVFAGKTAVYVINLSSGNKRLVVGSQVQGYLEGIGLAARFMAITDIVSGPDMLQQNILVSDYGAGCIRQVNLITQLTRQVFGKCSTNPHLEDPANYVRATAIIQNPNEPNVYYVGGRDFIRKLRRLGNGKWSMQSLGFRFVLEKVALLWNYNIVYIVGTNSIWMTSSSQRIDILASDSSWDGTRMRLSSAIIHQNRWLVATDRSYEIFRVFDVRTNATFSLCNQFGGKSCALRNPVAIINHPLKLNSYLVAGNELYEVEFKDERSKPTVNTFTTREHIVFAVAGLMLITFLAIFIFLIICARNLQTKLTKRQKKANTKVTSVHPMPLGTPVYVFSIPQQYPSFGQQATLLKQTQVVASRNNINAPTPEKQEIPPQQCSILKNDAEEKQPEIIEVAKTSKRNCKSY